MQEPVHVFLDMARAIEQGHGIDLESWEAAETRALRVSRDDHLRVVIRDLHKSGARLLRARLRECPTVYYAQNFQACRVHLVEVLRTIPEKLILT